MSTCKSVAPMATRYVFLLHCAQVPQFILDDAIMSGRGSRCHVICTQPRRISAISGAHIQLPHCGIQACEMLLIQNFIPSAYVLSKMLVIVARRVAQERGERLGQSAGFQIRLENELPRTQGSILYCTTGILLRRLIGDPYVDHVTCVCVCVCGGGFV